MCEQTKIILKINKTVKDKDRLHGDNRFEKKNFKM